MSRRRERPFTNSNTAKFAEEVELNQSYDIMRYHVMYDTMYRCGS